MKRLLVHPMSSANWKIFWRKHLRHRPFNQASRIQRVLAILSIFVRTPFYLLEKIVYDRRLAAHKIESGPIFIIGHWRSGTTHLHNILSQDEQFSYLSFSNMVMPHDLLVGRYFPVIPLIMKMNLPKTRGIDSLPIKPNLPQEEELSLGMIGGVSYYNCYFFPKRWKEYFTESILMKSSSGNCDPPEKILANAYRKLVNKLSYFHQGRQLIFKNPASTGRIAMLKEIFPNAKFVHVRRNPYSVFASSRARLPRMIDGFSGTDDLDMDYDTIAMDSYRLLMKEYFSQRGRIPQKDLLEVSYEELIDNPDKTISDIYSKFGLTQSDDTALRIKRYLDSQKSYQRNTHRLSRSQIERIQSDWDFVFEKWNYQLPPDLDIID